jgi:hypothetical protein
MFASSTGPRDRFTQRPRASGYLTHCPPSSDLAGATVPCTLRPPWRNAARHALATAWNIPAVALMAVACAQDPSRQVPDEVDYAAAARKFAVFDRVRACSCLPDGTVDLLTEREDSIAREIRCHFRRVVDSRITQFPDYAPVVALAYSRGYPRPRRYTEVRLTTERYEAMKWIATHRHLFSDWLPPSDGLLDQEFSDFRMSAYRNYKVDVGAADEEYAVVVRAEQRERAFQRCMRMTGDNYGRCRSYRD